MTETDGTAIEGIGGVFLFSNDPGRLADWYAEHLGIAFEFRMESGAAGLTYRAQDPDGKGVVYPTVFSIMEARVALPALEADAKPESPYGDARVMINLRTRDLAGLLARLAERGVTPTGDETNDYGRFAWVYDGDGNRLELWEPPAELPAV